MSKALYSIGIFLSIASLIINLFNMVDFRELGLMTQFYIALFWVSVNSTTIILNSISLYKD